jgi:hypothetical protein
MIDEPAALEIVQERLDIRVIELHHPTRRQTLLAKPAAEFWQL